MADNVVVSYSQRKRIRERVKERERERKRERCNISPHRTCTTGKGRVGVGGEEERNSLICFSSFSLSPAVNVNYILFFDFLPPIYPDTFYSPFLFYAIL